MQGLLRYAALASGTILVLAGWFMDKIPSEAGMAAITVILGIAAADMYKHRDSTE